MGNANDGAMQGEFCLAQPLGPDPDVADPHQRDSPGLSVTYMHNAKPKMTNKAVMAGAYVYLLIW